MGMSLEAGFGGQDARRLVWVCLMVVVLWTANGASNVIVLYVLEPIADAPVTFKFWRVVHREITATILWILFTPLAVWIAQRCPLRTTRRWNVAPLGGAVVGLSLLRAVAGAFVERDFLSVAVSWPRVRAHVAICSLSHFYEVVLLVGITTVVRERRESLERQMEAFSTARRLARLEMNDLHAHLRPEFLFMTLRGIGRVLHTNAAAADGMIVDLSELLRRTLARSREASFGEALEQLDRYVALHAAASEIAMTLHLDVEDELLSARMPIVAVSPLVEEAVLHSAARGGGRIDVTAGTVSSHLKIVVRGKPQWSAPTGPAGGAGLQVLRSQLELLYASDYVLDAQSGDDWFTAVLEMPFEPLERTDRS